MSIRTQTYPLRLPISLKSAVEAFSKQDGTSINQFVVTAVAEKLSALHTVAYFESRKATRDEAAFLRVLNRKGGEPPRAGDEMPPVQRKSRKR